MLDSPLTKILVVDDEPFIRDIVSRWLQDEGHECVTAANVEEAWKILEEDTFSLMLLDIMMPEEVGIVLLHKIREKQMDLAVIMISGVEPGIAKDTLELGAYMYLTKPFDKVDVVINVASALKRREEMLKARDCQKRLEDEIRELKSEKGRGSHLRDSSD
jgi:DNA-binding NtrC family response regulator